MDSLAIWSNRTSDLSPDPSRDLSRDRGLFYGDGLFETIRISAGEPVWLDAHLARLQRGCDALSIPFPDTIRTEIARGLQASQLHNAVLKLVLTRQATSRGYALDPRAGSNLYVLLYDAPAKPKIRDERHTLGLVGLCSTRLGIQPQLAGHKHLNRLEQVLARSEWQHPELVEGLMLDTDGYLIEATASNIFLVHGTQLITPQLDRCGVAGVMREWVLSVAVELGYEPAEQRVTLTDIEKADGLLLTSSLLGVVAASGYVGSIADLPDADGPLAPKITYEWQAGQRVAQIFRNALANAS